MMPRKPVAQRVGRIPIAAAILSLFACVIWLPALDTPFWGDDYVFLNAAHAANTAGEPWWAAFWPEEPYKFWRPLSQDSYWRVIDSLVGDNPWMAHLVNLGLFSLAGISVGLLGLALARSCEWPDPPQFALIGGLLYTSLALNLLPVHWVSAANSSILVILTASCLSLWILAPQMQPALRRLLLGTIPILLAAALLSKESAALIPLLMVVLSLFIGANARPRRAEMLVWLLCCAIVAGWLVLRPNFISATDSQYDIALGDNLIRNVVSLAFWLLNVPREALRLLVAGPVASGFLWIFAVAAPMLIAWAMAVRPLSRMLVRRQVVAAAAFVLVAYAPYFPLAWNSYAYYAAVAAILPTLILAGGLLYSRFLLLGVTLVGISAAISVQGTRWLEHPGLIGRARWAEQTLSMLEKEPTPRSLLVQPADGQRFYAMGVAGLAWRLGLPQRDIRIVKNCPPESDRCLVINSKGEWSWKGHGSGHTVAAGDE